MRIAKFLWDEPPMRVWKYRGWSAVCNVCMVSAGGPFRSQQHALNAAHLHLDEHIKQIARPLKGSFAWEKERQG